jgi:murein DD-endopeptidase MepM/ murein hydrolase activator NlpD
MIKFKNNPTKNKIIKSPFGNRIHPVTKKLAMHNGIDLAPLKNKVDGDPLYAVADGIVVINKINAGGIDKGYGNYIVIQHDGFATLYGHMMKLSPLKVGTKITAGTVVGQMGTTGRSTGTHLHFGVSLGDYIKSSIKGKIDWVDPELYLTNGIVKEDDEEVVNKIKIEINGQVKEVDAINKDGNNFVKLRDLSDAIVVEYDQKRNLPVVKSKK